MSANTPETENSKKKRRAPKTAWRKGQSGNPNGRPPLTEAQRMAREIKQRAQPEVMEAMVAIALNRGEETRDRIAAGKVVLEGLDATKIDLDVTTDDGDLTKLIERLGLVKEK